MRFLRAATKALFYDYPLNAVVECLQRNNSDMRLLDLFTPLLSRQHKAFTISEIKQLKLVVEKQWLLDEKDSTSQKNPNFNYDARLSFRLLERCSDAFLNITENRPVVRFPQLLRWRELTHYIGEDLVSIAALVKSDVEKNHDINLRNNFFWEDILNHDCRDINYIFEEGLSDNHAHLDASSDVFSFNWLALMNTPALLNTKLTKKNFDFIDNNLHEYDYIAVHSPINPTLRQWTYLAAMIRVMLYCKVEDNIDLLNRSFKTVNNIIKNIDKVKLPTESSSEVINILKNESLRTFHGKVTLDYAISASVASSLSANDISSPYMIHYGERRLIYKLLFLIHANRIGDDRLATLFYLYLLIKNKVRREFVECNLLKGFENFQSHQNIKGKFFDHTLKELNTIYAVQSSITGNTHHKLEARIAPDAVDDVIKPYLYSPIFSKSYENALGRSGIDGDDAILQPGGFSKEYIEDFKERVTFVVHFLKSDKFAENSSLSARPYRFGDLRNKTWQRIDDLLSKIVKDETPFQITGIDVAGAELNCRPEIFAPMFRRAKYCGLNNVTYHAGEDFYDLADGMRAIYELITFMDYENGDRIGHALALGMDATSYYEDRENIVIIPRQILLDNLVWMHYYAMKSGIRLEEKTAYFIEKYSALLQQDIGYARSTMFEYWQSMTMRGDDIVRHSVNSPRRLVERCKSYKDETRLPRAVELHKQYEGDWEVIEKGCVPMELKLPTSFAGDVAKLQLSMLQLIERKGIQIECNPTSNVMIGGFGRYSKLPLFKFHTPPGKPGMKLNISVNTDDRGVFQTSLQNELSLLAISMKKEKGLEGEAVYNFDDIKNYISKLSEMGRKMRFRPLNLP